MSHFFKVISLHPSQFNPHFEKTADCTHSITIHFWLVSIIIWNLCCQSCALFLWTFSAMANHSFFAVLALHKCCHLFILPLISGIVMSQIWLARECYGVIQFLMWSLIEFIHCIMWSCKKRATTKGNNSIGYLHNLSIWEDNFSLK